MSLPSQQPLTVSELSMLRELFARIDTDGDGKIDIDNLKEAFKQNGWELTEHEAKVLIASIDDVDGDGQVTWDQVLKMVSTRPFKRKIEKELRYVFDAYDEQGTGYLTTNDVRLLLAETGDAEQLKDGEMASLLAQLNDLASHAHKEGSGRGVSFEHFATVYMQYFC